MYIKCKCINHCIDLILLTSQITLLQLYMIDEGSTVVSKRLTFCNCSIVITLIILHCSWIFYGNCYKCNMHVCKFSYIHEVAVTWNIVVAFWFLQCSVYNHFTCQQTNVALQQSGKFNTKHFGNCSIIPGV